MLPCKIGLNSTRNETFPFLLHKATINKSDLCLGASSALGSAHKNTDGRCWCAAELNKTSDYEKEYRRSCRAMCGCLSPTNRTFDPLWMITLIMNALTHFQWAAWMLGWVWILTGGICAALGLCLWCPDSLTQQSSPRENPTEDHHHHHHNWLPRQQLCLYFISCMSKWSVLCQSLQ